MYLLLKYDLSPTQVFMSGTTREEFNSQLRYPPLNNLLSYTTLNCHCEPGSMGHCEVMNHLHYLII